MLVDVKPGTRVKVSGGNGVDDLGLGTYEGEEKLNLAYMKDGKSILLLSHVNEEKLNELIKQAKGTVLKRDFQLTPKIKLDTGRIIYGSQCWWEVVDGEAA